MGSIQEFFASKTVLVTGATGFLGGVLVERLLSSCPDLEEIFVVARPRKGQSSEQRLLSLLSLPIFEHLDEESKKKVTLLTGDVTMSNIGLSWADIERIKERVHVVFHVAAIVNFSTALDKAVITNVGGTAAILSLAKEVNNLQAFIYVSTAYCNCTKSEYIEEKVYQSHWNPVEFLREVMETPSEEINRRTEELLVGQPNTYSFSKQLAENLIAQERGNLPVAIVRPSIVLNTAERPVKGWTYNVLSGAFAFIAGAGRGAFRTIYADGNAVADLVPCDYLAAFLLATAKRTADRGDLQVYHYTSGTVKPIRWSEYVSSVMKHMEDFPSTNAIIPQRAKCRKNYFHNWLVVILFQFLPALLVDFSGLVMDAPYKIWEIQMKYARGLNYASKFTLREWWFSTDNQMEVWHEMGQDDRREFWFNLEDFDWDGYIKTCVLGVRKYFHNQDENNLIRAKSIHRVRKLVYYSGWVFAYFVTFCFLLFFTSSTISSVLALIFILFMFWV